MCLLKLAIYPASSKGRANALQLGNRNSFEEERVCLKITMIGFLALLSWIRGIRFNRVDIQEVHNLPQ